MKNMEVYNSIINGSVYKNVENGLLALKMQKNI